MPSQAYKLRGLVKKFLKSNTIIIAQIIARKTYPIEEFNDDSNTYNTQELYDRLVARVKNEKQNTWASYLKSNYSGIKAQLPTLTNKKEVKAQNPTLSKTEINAIVKAQNKQIKQQIVAELSQKFKSIKNKIKLYDAHPHEYKIQLDLYLADKIQADHQNIVCKTRHRLDLLYPENTVIQIFNDQDETQEYKDFRSRLGDSPTIDHRMQRALESKTKQISSLKITRIQRDSRLLKPSKNLLGVSNYKNSAVRVQSRGLVYPKFLQADEKAKQELCNQDCVIQAILATFKNNWDKYHKSNPLTHEYLAQLFGCKDDFGVSVNTAMSKFFEPNGLKFQCEDILGNVLVKYPPQGKEPNHHIRGMLIVLLCNSHWYVKTEKLMQLNRVKKEVETTFVQSPSENIYIATAKVERVFMPNFFADIFNFDFQPYEKTGITISTSTPISFIIQQFYQKYNCIADYDSKRNCLSFNHANCQVIVEGLHQQSIMTQLQFETNLQFQEFQTVKFEFNRKLLTSRYVSTHTTEWYDIATRYICKPLTGRWLNPNLKSTIYADDYTKEYSYCLMNLENLLQCNTFDTWLNYDEKSISRNCFYVVAQNETSPKCVVDIVIQEGATIFRGSELIALKSMNIIAGRDYDIVLYSTIGNHHKNEMRQHVEKVYSNSILSILQKKFIVNSAIGSIAKTVNRRTKSITFPEQEEACYYGNKLNLPVFSYDFAINNHIQHDDQCQKNDLCNCKSCGGQVVVDKQTALWVVESQTQSKLCKSSFLPISISIQSLARYRMVVKYLTIVQAGGIPFQIQTDCIYYTTPHLVVQKPYDTQLPQNFGKNTVEQTNDIQARKHLKAFRERPCSLIQQKEMHQITLASEPHYLIQPQEYTQEILELLTKHQFLMIKGCSAGAGKTRAGIDVLKQIRKFDPDAKILISTNNNQRIDELIQQTENQNFSVMTLCNLLGFRLTEDKEIVRKQGHLHESIDYLLVDEIYLSNTHILSNLFAFIQKYPNIKVIGTGDVKQNKFITENGIEDIDSHIERQMQTIFKHAVLLNINKRFSVQGDAESVKILQQFVEHPDWRANGKQLPAFIKTFTNINDLNHIAFPRGKYNGARCITNHCDSQMHVNEIMLELWHQNNPKVEYVIMNGKKLHLGQILVCRKQITIQSKKMMINFKYLVSNINVKDELITLTTSKSTSFKTVVRTDYIIKSSDLKYFTYDFACTSMSSQGSTYENVPVILFDIAETFVNACNIYTSATRANKIDNIYVYRGESTRFDISQQDVNSRIRAHKSADIASNRDVDAKYFIDCEFIKQLILQSGMHCNLCYQELTLDNGHDNTYSIDRIDNDIAHHKNNVRIVCKSCNCANRKAEHLC